MIETFSLEKKKKKKHVSLGFSKYINLVKWLTCLIVDMIYREFNSEESYMKYANIKHNTQFKKVLTFLLNPN